MRNKTDRNWPPMHPNALHVSVPGPAPMPRCYEAETVIAALRTDAGRYSMVLPTRREGNK